MKNLKLGASSAIFILFFGAALLDALSGQEWIRVGVFLALGVLSLWADAKKE